MKFNLTPRLHCRLLFLQLLQLGKPSSHFKCRSLHVRQPVRTRFGFDASPSFSPSPLASVLGLSRGPTLMTFLAGFDPDELGAFLRFFGGAMFSGVTLIGG